MSGVHPRVRYWQEHFRITTAEQLLVAGPSEKDWFRNLFLSQMVQECGLLLPVIIHLPADLSRNRIKLDLKSTSMILTKGILMVSFKSLIVFIFLTH